MHQSLLIYAQATVSEIMATILIRGSSTITSVAQTVYEKYIRFNWIPPGTSVILTSCLSYIELMETGGIRMVPNSDIKGKVHYAEQSHSLGRACGFLYGDLKMCGDSRSEDSSIFPLSLKKKEYWSD
ncbi:unnamed protein product [Leptidea sinapis]|uniref:Virus-capping methyltransferase connector domain-containing protein n=1 Tax=Leptidea sinapis TaxID=189913 RepID=A0A5E4PQH4_9NEOP|nr:unnamed protein product [Leptidea sinapis]